jgi:hypothetical protein
MKSWRVPLPERISYPGRNLKVAPNIRAEARWTVILDAQRPVARAASVEIWR